MESPWGTKGRGEAAGDAPRGRQEHPSGWSRGAGWEGDPRAAQDGGPGWVWGSLSAPAPRGTRGCSRCPAPGEARALPSLRSLSACPPAALPHPAPAPPPAPASLLAVCRLLWKAGFSPKPRGELFPRPRQHQGLHRPLRGGAGGKQAAAAWLLIHHLQPPRGSARNASSRERWGRGEQGPRHLLAALRWSFGDANVTPERTAGASSGDRDGGKPGKGKGAVRCSQSEGDVVPVAQRAPLGAAPSSASRLDAALLTHRLVVPQQHSPLRLPKKASSWREPFWEAPQLDPNSQHPLPARTRFPRMSPTPEPECPSSTSGLHVTPQIPLSLGSKVSRISRHLLPP